MAALPEDSEACRWLRFALDDLRSATAVAKDDHSNPNVVCVLSQQAAEKALKAVLVARSVRVPRTHDLLELRALAGVGIAEDIIGEDLVRLSDWAIKARYPGGWREADAQDASHSRAIAATICDGAEGYLGEAERSDS